MKHEKPIYWVGTSYKDLLTFPPEVKQVAGYQLHLIQNGFEPENWKPFQTIGAGVKEIRITEDGNAYRIMYIAKFSERIYVLHSFKKKTQKTSSKDINIAKTRYNIIANKENYE
ncbi:MAG: type II toxin-antitoxin system RelE/ParE family toxin [Thiomargarita sp.]|nr:type II toxin-antitoxin system RelE/ParE family toxin [Thiomargarita sp.]